MNGLWWGNKHIYRKVGTESRVEQIEVTLQQLLSNVSHLSPNIIY